MSLLELAPGEGAVIERLEAHSDDEALLRAMGILEGEPVRVLRQAPLGGPLHVRVRDAAFALGRSLARAVIVRRDP